MNLVTRSHTEEAKQAKRQLLLNSAVSVFSQKGFHDSKMQDIAGCRVVLRSPQDQNVVQILLVEAFPGCKVIDRREKPSHGYRAVHVLVTVGNRVVEVQIRTTLQHLWAQLSEAYADALGSAIKYGGGDPAIREFLLESSDQIQQWEARYMMPVAGLSEVEMNAYFWNLELTWTKIAESMKSMVSLTKSNI